MATRVFICLVLSLILSVVRGDLIDQYLKDVAASSTNDPAYPPSNVVNGNANTISSNNLRRL